MTRRKRLLALVVAVLVAGALVWFFALRDDDSDGDGGPNTTRPLIGQPDEVDTLRDEALALLREAQEGTVHARYESVGDSAGGAFPRAIEVWRREGQSRTDTEYAAEGRVARSASFRLTSGAVACQQIDDGPWSCVNADDAGGDLFDQAAADLAGADVAATNKRVQERDARCFTFQGEDSVELCFNDDGLLLRLAVGSSALELVDADGDVNDDDFTPPAEPTDAPPVTDPPVTEAPGTVPPTTVP
jgi:hypothetical protein